MIYERVNWLNKGETGAKPINKTNLNQMDKGIYDLQNIELIGVEKTAPTECTTGDKYFNTTDKKIYTATADNTWGETGETPLRGILYVIISSQTSYYYDGDTLISIGGGNGGTTIPVSATPPENPEDGALWVDTDDEGVIVEVDQEVSTSSKNAVSNSAITNYVNGINKYSTEEKVVGEWIDGKPIYRKVFVLNETILLKLGEWTNIVDVSSLNISVITDITMISEQLAWTGALTKIDSNYLQLAGIGRDNTAWFVKTLILEYTKTTDVPEEV